MARDFIRSLPEHERSVASGWLNSVHIDPILLFLLLLLVGYGLVVLYSAVGQSEALFQAQLLRLGLAFVVLFVTAQLPPRLYVRWDPLTLTPTTNTAATKATPAR